MPRRILEAIEVTTAISVFGYMTLRAHWNYLGVTSMAGMGIDRYLMEVYSIVVGELPYALLIAAVIAGVVLPMRWLFRAARDRMQRLDAFARRVEMRMRQGLDVVILILLAIAQVQLLKAVSGTCRNDVVLGDLKTHVAHRCYEAEPRLVLFHAIVLLCIIAGLVYRNAPEARRRRIVAIAAVLIALQLPTLYGMSVKARLYPGARIVMASTKDSIPGLLMLQTTEFVELWTVRDGRGEMVVVPRENIGSMTAVDLRDIFTVAQTVGRNPATLAKACGVE